MKTIIHKEEFIELVKSCDELICFVHSNWSVTSMMSLKIFQELCTKRPELNCAIIENDNGDSFIYEWLKDQEDGFEKNNSKLIKRAGSWIHGNGELIGVIKGKFIWFESTLNGQTLVDLNEKSYWK